MKLTLIHKLLYRLSSLVILVCLIFSNSGFLASIPAVQAQGSEPDLSNSIQATGDLIDPLILDSNNLPTVIRGRLTDESILLREVIWADGSGEVENIGGLDVEIDFPEGPYEVGVQYPVSFQVSHSSDGIWISDGCALCIPYEILAFDSSALSIFYDEGRANIYDDYLHFDGKTVSQTVVTGALTFPSSGIELLTLPLEMFLHAAVEWLVDKLAETANSASLSGALNDFTPTDNIDYLNHSSHSSVETVEPKVARVVFGNEDLGTNDLAEVDTFTIIFNIEFTEPGLHEIIFAPDLRVNFSGKPNDLITLPILSQFEYRDDIVLQVLVEDNNSPPNLSNPELLPNSVGDSSTQFTFKVTYKDADNEPPDSVWVTINGTDIPLSATSSDYATGVVYSSSPMTFNEGTYIYGFKAIQGSIEKNTNNFTFDVVNEATGVTLTASNYSPQFNGSSVDLTATVQNDFGNPVGGVVVEFSSYPGGINPRFYTTDQNGKAYSTFTPDEIGAATVSATIAGGESDTKIINTVADDNAIDIDIVVGPYSRTETESQYDIDVQAFWKDSGETVDYTPVKFTVRDSSSSLYGTMWDDGASQWKNPAMDETDNYGRSSTKLKITSSGTAIITVEIAGSTRSITTNLIAGELTPSNRQPFIVLPLNVGSNYITDLAVSPDGNYLVASAFQEDATTVFDLTDYSVHLRPLDEPNRDYFNEANGVAYSPNGNYFAFAMDEIGSSSSGTSYAMLVYNSNFSFKCTNIFNDLDEVVDLDDISFSPDSTKIATVEDRPTPLYALPRLSIWSVSNCARQSTVQVGSGSMNDLESVAWSGPISGYSSGIIAVGGGDSNMPLYFYNGSNSAKIREVPTFDGNEIYDLAWQPGGDKLIGGHDSDTDGNAVILYDWSANSTVFLTEHWDLVSGVEWNPTGDKFASVDWAGHIIIWDSAGNLVETFGTGNKYAAVKWSTDGKELYVARYSGGIEVYALDDVEPPLTQITSPQNLSQVQTTTVTVTGKITDPHFVSSATLKVNGGGPVTLSLDSNGNFSQEVSLVIGDNTITVDAVDGSGNSGSMSITVTRLVDNDPPIFSNMQKSPDNGAPGQSFTISGTIQDLWSGLNTSSVAFDIEYPDGANVITLTPSQSGNIFTAIWDSSGVTGEGVYYVDFRASDMEGNNGEANNGVSFLIEDDPIVSDIVISPTNPADSDPIFVTVDVSDLSSIAEAHLTYTHSVSGVPVTLTMTDIGNGQWQATIPPQIKGTLNIEAGATDIRGNNSQQNATTQVNITDESAPLIYYWQQTPINLTENSIGSVVIKVKVIDVGGGEVSGTPAFDFTFDNEPYNGYEAMTDDGNGLWSFTISAEDWDSIQGKTLKYRVQAMDDSSNITVSEEHTDTIDMINDKPVIDSYDPLESNIGVQTCQIFSIVASDEETLTLEYTWYLDSDLAGTGSSYEYCVSDNDSHIVQVIVTDGEYYVDHSWSIDNEAPTVMSIILANTNPTSATSVDFNVMFSEVVIGVDESDFSLTTTENVSGVSVTNVGGSGDNYTVTVNTGSGNGTLRLDLIDDNSIEDSFGNSLGGLEVGDGDFTGGEEYNIITSATFADVPTSHWAWQYVESVYLAGVTGGCGTSPLIYCPNNSVTRAQMAIFLLKAKYGDTYMPPAATGVFDDVSTSFWAADWIEQLAAEGITGGCGGSNYCPNNVVTRAQMAVFLLKAKYGNAYVPPVAAGVFTDVSTSFWAADWIEQLAAEGITSGCGGRDYCPNNSVNRAQMAVFLQKTFNLPLP